MSRLNGEQLYEIIGRLPDELVTEALPLSVLGGAAAVGGVTPTLHSLSSAGSGTAAKAGFGAWLAKGGWIALTAGALVAAGVAVGAFFLGQGGDTPPVGTDTVTTDEQGGNLPVGEMTEELTEGESTESPQSCDHTFGDWTEARAATCTESGLRSRACARCGKTETETIIPLPHTFKNDVCTVCGASVSKLEFTSNGDGTCYISGWGQEDQNGGESPLVIPTYSPSGDRVISIQAGALSDVKPFRSYPEEIIVSEGVEVIEPQAFEGCSWLKSITLPSTLISIGNNAFTSSDLRSVTMAEGLRSIETGAFSMTHLTSVTIPASVTEVGNAAFSWIDDLKEFHFAEGTTLTALPDSLFWKTGLIEISLPDSMTVIGEHAFESCSKLTAVHAANVTEIGTEAFSGCCSLTTLPDSLKIDGIGANALQGCTALATTEYDGGYYMTMDGNPYAILLCGKSDVTTASLHPNTQLAMGSAFEGNTVLTTFVFPDTDTPTAISDRFFYGCTALTSVEISPSVTHIGNESFYGCTALAEILLPDTIEEIGTAAFAQCQALTSIRLPASLKVISANLLYDCNALTDVYIPDGVTTIMEVPFTGCKNLETLVLPKSVIRFVGTITRYDFTAIEYAGTKAEWEAIEKDEDWRDTGRKATLVVIFCTDGHINP